MELTLILIGVVIMICVLLNQLSYRIGIPALLFFIILGMCFGSDGLLKIQFNDYQLVESFSMIALVFIIFYGGFTTKWTSAKKIIPQSIVLSTLGIILMTLLTGLFCFYVLGFEWLESFLIGAVLSSTDSASVFFILRSQRLNLKYKTASLLEVESGSNDPFAYTITMIILSLMSLSMTPMDMVSIFVSQVVFGLLFGALIAYIGYLIFHYFKKYTADLSTLLVVALALLSYGVPTYFNGNGFLSVYIVGIVLGNMVIDDKKAMIHFFDGIVDLLQMILFFLLGLLSFPSQMGTILFESILIGLFLLVIARPIVVGVILKCFKRPLNQIGVVSFAGLRGATSIIFAIMVTVSTAYTKNDIFHIVFCVVLLSMLIQGTLLPYICRYLNMIDDHENVLKTFTDYTEENQVQFLHITLNQNHDWLNQYIHTITLPPSMRIVMIKRDNQWIIPKGSLKLHLNDQIILSAFDSETPTDITLKEELIDSDHPWFECCLKDIVLDNALIVLIKRNDQTIIPIGKTKLKENDVIVIAQT